jgi:3-hydroxyisobutyrate dehydrogenase
MSIEPVSPAGVAAPVGAYSHAIRCGDTVYTSGQVAMDADGNVVGVGDIAAQVKQVFKNLDLVLESAGARRDQIVKMNVFLTDMDARAAVSKARREYVAEPHPASTLIGVNALAHPDLLVEVDAVAVLGE